MGRDVCIVSRSPVYVIAALDHTLFLFYVPGATMPGEEILGHRTGWMHVTLLNLGEGLVKRQRCSSGGYEAGATTYWVSIGYEP